VVCYYALAAKDELKKAFTKLLQARGRQESEEGEEELDTETGEVISKADDALEAELKRRRLRSQMYITISAKLIPESLYTENMPAGYDFVIEALGSAGMQDVANEMEMAKAIAHMHEKDFQQAIIVLKGFEKKEEKLKARAATNLSFLYFLESDLANAEKYAEMAVQADKYNAKALVNKGNCLYMRQEVEKAREKYAEAVSVEADCVEAIYNFGLVCKTLGSFKDSLESFTKLNTLLPDNMEVVYEIASVYELQGQHRQALKWFEILNSRVMHDPGILARMGSLHAYLEEETRAYHYYAESHRVYPVNMDVISWLGAHHVQNEMYEKAVPFFELASRINPLEVKWKLMVASCYRRVEAFSLALRKYKEVHKAHPNNVECLRYLVAMCSDLNRKEEVQEYIIKLRKEERFQSEQLAAKQAMQAEANGGQIPGEEEEQNKYANDARMARHELVNETERPKEKPRQAKAPQPKDHDDWGSEELGEDLLPM